MQAAIGNSPLVRPGTEDRADGAPELILHILRERPAEFLLDLRLVLNDEPFPVIGGHVGIEQIAVLFLHDFEKFLEMVMLHPEDDIGIHLDKAAVAVIGEALVAALGFQPLHGLIIEAKVEDGVHHAGHRGAGTGAHRDKQRLHCIAKPAADGFLDRVNGRIDLIRKRIGIDLVIFKIGRADFRRDGKSRGHRQSEIAHLRQVGPLAAQQIAHVRRAVRLAIAERIYPLRHRQIVLLNICLNSLYAPKVKISLLFRFYRHFFSAQFY